VRNNHIGICFTQEPISDATDSLLNHTTDIDASEILQSDEEWKQFSTEWTSDFEAQYLILGNFKSDEETKMIIPSSQTLGFGYYYIDDILIHKLPPIIEVPVADDDLTKIKLEAGKTITLKNIYFDFDRTELLPLSYIELNKLIGLMKKHPLMEIEIKGHTDNSGSKEYNLDLSFARAKAVTNYLTQQGISSDRISKRGYGHSVPIASNKSAEGRQINRRVEFYIKAM
jgi:outer membrane protein OmpA-like peptidoglycan-associated protein